MGADLGRYGEPILPGAVNMPPTTRSSVVARPVASGGSLTHLRRSDRYQAAIRSGHAPNGAPAGPSQLKVAADISLAAKRNELDAGTAVDDKPRNRPLREWWPGHWRSTQSRRAAASGAPGRRDRRVLRSVA